MYSSLSLSPSLAQHVQHSAPSVIYARIERVGKQAGPNWSSSASQQLQMKHTNSHRSSCSSLDPRRFKRLSGSLQRAQEERARFFHFDKPNTIIKRIKNNKRCWKTKVRPRQATSTSRQRRRSTSFMAPQSSVFTHSQSILH